MLNELYQVVKALDARGITIEEQHVSLTPMGKNDPLLVVELDKDGNPSKIVVEQGDVAGRLLRICHGSQGASFPGFNLPTPLRGFNRAGQDKLKKRFTELRRRRRDAKWVGRFLGKLFNRSRPIEFANSQSRQFQKSCKELVGWLREDFVTAGPELTNFTGLLKVADCAHLELASFANQIAFKLATSAHDVELAQRWLFAEWLFTNRKLAVYLQCHDEDIHKCRVADMRMGKLLNQHLLAISAKPYDSSSRSVGSVATSATDAYTGQQCEIPDTFPSPKVALLGNVRLFSNNADEAGCFFRYGLGGSTTFKVSKATAQRMAGALLHVASDDRMNKTCRAIPGNRSGQQDLLIAYLEDEPDAPDPYIDLFGSAADNFADPDFAATAKPVLETLEGKVPVNPNQLIRLIAIAALDKANKQVSLNRCFTVREVMQAAQAWQKGAANCPPVTLPFFDRQAKKLLHKERTVPSPLETATVLNRVWSSSGGGDFTSEFQPAITVNGAYDLFLPQSPFRESKTRLALKTLLVRMRGVFAATGRLKATSDFNQLNELARWQVLKAVALVGIFLYQLNQQREVFMKDSIYQVGRLLALADSLHFEYCKWVRTSAEKRKQGKVDAPGELIGNALFSSALDNPKRALARLAERIKPYQGWAKTYSGEEDWKGRWLLRLMSDCERQLDLITLPERMQDLDKATLLLGYLADNPKSKPEGE